MQNDSLMFAYVRKGSLNAREMFKRRVGRRRRNKRLLLIHLNPAGSNQIKPNENTDSQRERQFDQSRLNRVSNYGRVTPHSEKPPGNVASPN
jgi:hypothetical protein